MKYDINNKVTITRLKADIKQFDLNNFGWSERLENWDIYVGYNKRKCDKGISKKMYIILFI